ncbi:MAG: peptide-methionine (S)-S-oxide reductase MsrA [Calditrichia bacterium]
MKKMLNMAITFLLTTGVSVMIQSKDTKEKKAAQNRLQKAPFARGCFWCMEPPFDNLPGVISTTVGYTGGHVPHPTYEEVSTGKTGHLEAIQIEFDSTKIGYQELLEIFWMNIDPTNSSGQFADYGSQYRTAIFYHNPKQKRLAEESRAQLARSGKFDKPIVTEILPAEEFYPAEDYHQEFYKKNPWRYYNYKVGSGRAGYLKEKWEKEK